MKFKVGDTVRCVRDFAPGGIERKTSSWVGKIFTITAYSDGREFPYCSREIGGVDCPAWRDEELELIEPLTNTIMSTLSEKFVLAFKKEPEKSFRKAGITNGDDVLTDEGQKIFMTWMLNKNAVEFKKDVVDGILAELAEEKK